MRQRILSDGDSPASKIVFLAGPRGAGKTFLAQDIARFFKNSLYLNCALAEDERALRDNKHRLAEFVVIDEMHKLPGWREFAAGIFAAPPAKTIVIGNAHVEALVKTRIPVYRVFPFTPAELAAVSGGADMDALLSRGGFPEPYLSGSDSFSRNWRAGYIERLFSEDINSFTLLYDIDALRRCFEFLRRSVGEPVSYARVKRETGLSNITAKKYLHILEALGVIFLVRPFFSRIPRALKKEPKVYFYDTGLVEGAEKKCENLAALSLFRAASEGGASSVLHYVQTRDGRKVDFCFAKNNEPRFFAEVSASETVDKGLKYFCRKCGSRGVQIVQNIEREHRWQDTGKGGAVEIRRADTFLEALA